MNVLPAIQIQWLSDCLSYRKMQRKEPYSPVKSTESFEISRSVNLTLSSASIFRFRIYISRFRKRQRQLRVGRSDIDRCDEEDSLNRLDDRRGLRHQMDKGGSGGVSSL
jgi:hypothetical protein